jgi:hypothetical protein
MKIDLMDVAMWSFFGGLYAFACTLLIGISIAAVCAPWPVNLVFIPLWLAIAGMWIFLTIMLGQRVLEEFRR